MSLICNELISLQYGTVHSSQMQSPQPASSTYQDAAPAPAPAPSVQPTSANLAHIMPEAELQAEFETVCIC